MKKVLLTIIILLTEIIAFSQPVESTEPLNPRYRDVDMPKNPEAVALGKYGLYDTNLYTGSPQISVPIYSHQGKEMNLPIVLTYDASGVKVEQTATNVGLGWNLQFGGVITREVNHLPDDLFEESGGGLGGVHYDKIYTNTTRDYINTIHDNDITDLFSDYSAYLPPSSSLEEADQLAREIWDLYKDKYSLDKIDLEPDIFKFNVNGMSDVILLDYDTEVGTGYKPFAKNNPDIKVKVEYAPGQNSTLKYINKWIITDEKGFEYYFEKQIDRQYQLEKEYLGATGIYTRKYVEAWYLTKIVSPNSYDIYTFHYDDSGYFDEIHLITNRNVMAYSNYDFVNQGNSYYFSNGVVPHINRSLQIYLNEIKYNGTTVFSTEVANRQDKNNSKRYTRLNTHNNKGQIINKIDLHQSYFKQFETQNNDIYNSRLKLDGLSFYFDDPSKAKKYAFTYYNPYNVPKINSTAMDYWGFYNGKVTNPTLIVDRPNGITYNTGNRSPDFNFAINGTLKSIFFPTGGRTSFYYEPHRIQYGEIIGGLRLRKQVSFTLDEDLQSSEEKYYIYNDLQIFGSNPIDDPNDLQNIYESTGRDQQPLSFENISTLYKCTGSGLIPSGSSLYQFSQNMAQRPPHHITYAEVSEVFYNDNKYNGHVYYKFNNQDYAASGDQAESGPYVEITPDNGKIIEKTVYGVKNNNYAPLEKTEYTYEIVSNVDYNHISKGVTIYEDESYYLNVKIGKKNTGNYKKGRIFLLPCINTVNGDGTMNWSLYNSLLNDGNFEELTYTYPTSVKRLNPYKHFSFFSRITSEKHTSYFDNNEVTKTIDYIYSSPFHYKPTEIVNSFNEGNGLIEYTTKYDYPQDLVNNSPPEIDNSNLQYLVSKNIIGSPIKTEVYRDQQKLTTQRKFFEGGSLKSVRAAKSNLELEDKYTIDLRDSRGNPVIASVGNGLQNYYIWGYNGDYLLGKISPIPSPYQAGNGIHTIFNSSALNSINSIVDQSNNYSPNNQMIKDEFQDLAAEVPNSHVSGYITEPGVGIISAIDSKNDILNFEYDDQYRLEKTFNKENKLLVENQYHYRELIINDDDVPETSPFEFSIDAENNYDNSFTFKAQLIYGNNSNFSYNWSILNEGTDITGINAQNPNQYIVQYDCPTTHYFTSNIVVRCDITDNATGMTITKFSNKPYSCAEPISATELVVEEEREQINSQTVFTGISLKIMDLQGGTEGGLEYRWYYKVNNGSYIFIPNEDTQYGNESTVDENFLQKDNPITTTMYAICNASSVTFKCEIIDTLSSEQYILESESMNINCSDNQQ